MMRDDSTSDEGSYLTGRLLIAMPAMGDARFERAVILVCAHNAEHAMGLTVNHPVEGLTLPTLLDKLGVEADIQLPEDLVLLGGPVESERGFVLHTDDYTCPSSSIDVAEGVQMTPTREVLEALASHNRRPRHATLALGYAGWGPGQLDAEIQQNAWLSVSADETIVFDGDHDTKWRRAFAKLKIDPLLLSDAAGHA